MPASEVLAGEKMSRSKLEDSLYESMRLLSMSPGGFPMPVRELHPFWCCEHPRRDHKARYLDAPVYDFELCCWACESIGRSDWVHPEAKTRNWRCDFAWPDLRLIVEVEGGVYTQGRHTRASGFTKDIEKYNSISAAGWKLLRFSRREVTSGEALNVIRKVVSEAMAA